MNDNNTCCFKLKKKICGKPTALIYLGAPLCIGCWNKLCAEHEHDLKEYLTKQGFKLITEK